jgi:hypothetical protein
MIVEDQNLGSESRGKQDWVFLAVSKIGMLSK